MTENKVVQMLQRAGEALQVRPEEIAHQAEIHKLTQTAVKFSLNAITGGLVLEIDDRKLHLNESAKQTLFAMLLKDHSNNLGK